MLNDNYKKYGSDNVESRGPLKFLKKMRNRWHNELIARIEALEDTIVGLSDASGSGGNGYNKVYDRCLKRSTEKRRRDFSRLPVTKLEKKHFQNLRYVLDRQELLSLLPYSGQTQAVCAEIGVANGDFSQDIVRIAQPKKLHLVDAWGSERYSDELMRNVETIFSDLIENGAVQINRGLSTEVLPTFDNAYFDWVYIDTSHSYDVTIQELRICKDKVKPEGIITGHDYSMGNWITGFKYGVIEAVYQFCVEENWEIIYLTSDIRSPSFALRRL